MTIRTKYSGFGDFSKQRRFISWADRDGRKVPTDEKGHEHDAHDHTIHLWLRGLTDPKRVGVVLGRRFNLHGEPTGDALCGFDADACRDPNTGTLTAWADELIEHCDSFTEVSVSGTGIHPYFAMRPLEYEKLLAHNGQHYQASRQHEDDDESIHRLSKHHPSTTLFLGKRYFATTGQSHGAARPMRYLTADQVVSLVKRMKLSWSSDGGDHNGTIAEIDYDDKLARRFKQHIAKNDTLKKRIGGDTTGMQKTSRSDIAMSVANLTASTFSREEVRAFMLSGDASAKVREWAEEKPSALDWTINKAFDEGGDDGATVGENWPRENGLWDLLGLDAWMVRDIPAPDRLLGDLLTTTSRVLIAGTTGVGKTQLGLQMATHMAAGKNFLKWECHRAARVLYVDGEMSGLSMKGRAIDAHRRAEGGAGLKLAIYSHDMGEALLGDVMPPLNQPQGHDYVLKLIERLGGVDAVIFDNVMSLLDGTQKEEEGWNGVNALISALTRQRVGQLWLDHTGHANPERPYGTATKMWRMDTVGAIIPLQRDGQFVSFKLTFDAPGKARMRSMDNWQDFAAMNIRLDGDQWVIDNGGGAAQALPGWLEKFYGALERAIDRGTTPNQTTLDAWEAECRRPQPDGGEPLLKPLDIHDDRKTKDAKRVMFRNAKNQLEKCQWIHVDGQRVRNAKA